MRTFTLQDREILKLTYKNWKPRTDPYRYFQDFTSYLSPIEFNIWHIIRIEGLPFYMQYPVGNYFIDFADPVKKIGIEVDGKEWHLDKEKDLIRQNNLENIGWKIYRIDGKDTFFEYLIEDVEDEYGNIYEKTKYGELMIKLLDIYKKNKN